MVRCKGKTAAGTSCHNHTTNDNHYCRLHQAQVPIGEDCPVCIEPLTLEDVLSCMHQVHKACVKKAVDQLQDSLVDEGYPAFKYGRCPLCRAVQKDILAKPSSWYGTIEICSGSMKSLLDTIRDYEGWVSMEHIPNEILEQMPDAAEEEQILFANIAASILWLSEYTRGWRADRRLAVELPQRMRLTQYHPDGFRTQVFF